MVIPQYQEPIGLSNRAVECMENGDIRGANILLNSALYLLLDNNVCEAQVPKVLRFSWSNQAQLGPQGHVLDERFGPYMYSRGAIIEQVQKADLGPISEERAIILYNAALAAHLLAFLTAESALLSRAKSLYILSRQILAKRRIAAGVPFSLCRMHCFQVPLLNNLGQINYELSQFAIARQYFAKARPLVLALVKYARSHEQQVFGSFDLKGFHTNVVMEMPIVAACA